jgi:hypothetical protein
MTLMASIGTLLIPIVSGALLRIVKGESFGSTAKEGCKKQKINKIVVTIAAGRELPIGCLTSLDEDSGAVYSRCVCSFLSVVHTFSDFECCGELLLG